MGVTDPVSGSISKLRFALILSATLPELGFALCWMKASDMIDVQMKFL